MNMCFIKGFSIYELYSYLFSSEKILKKLNTISNQNINEQTEIYSCFDIV